METPLSVEATPGAATTLPLTMSLPLIERTSLCRERGVSVFVVDSLEPDAMVERQEAVVLQSGSSEDTKNGIFK
jgi:hypothetical protein